MTSVFFLILLCPGCLGVVSCHCFRREMHFHVFWLQTRRGFWVVFRIWYGTFFKFFQHSSCIVILNFKVLNVLLLFHCMYSSVGWLHTISLWMLMLVESECYNNSMLLVIGYPVRITGYHVMDRSLAECFSHCSCTQVEVQFFSWFFPSKLATYGVIPISCDIKTEIILI